MPHDAIKLRRLRGIAEELMEEDKEHERKAVEDEAWRLGYQSTGQASRMHQMYRMGVRDALDRAEEEPERMYTGQEWIDARGEGVGAAVETMNRLSKEERG